VKSVRLTILCATGLIFLYFTALAGAEAKNAKATSGSARPSKPSAAQQKLTEKHKELIEKKKASREGLENLLVDYEKQLENQSAAHEVKKGLYKTDFISKAELMESERALTNTQLKMQQVRQWIAEDDAALSLSEIAAQKELARLPNLPSGGYTETTTLIRYNGAANWSLASIGRIKKFFLSRFGRPLPVSAIGQSQTHDRMGFDHRNAIDVAVRPDSKEGRGLLAYLRKARIPFLAFRSKVPGVATGAHIHIGRPSPRIMQVKAGSSDIVASDQSSGLETAFSE
jgi:hypothetical protein